jgi:hypothetical protein
MKLSDNIHACALAALPDIGSDGALPADIQVFPPGRAVKFTLQDYPGEEFEMDVDATVAAKANADLQKLLSRASAGEGSRPFADKNHEDAEKTFTPLRYFWGGDDKVTGGVRVVPDWTPFGAALVRSKAFGYFSQNFFFSRAKKKFLGLINENIGGLVNRPGFATQQAFAKAAASITTTTIDTMTTDEFKQILDSALKPLGMTLVKTQQIAGEASVAENKNHPFLDEVYNYAKENKKSLAQALSDVTARNPGVASDYKKSMRAGSEVQARAAAPVAPKHKFMNMVEAHAKSSGKSIAEAASECAASNRALAEDYRASIISR